MMRKILIFLPVLLVSIAFANAQNAPASTTPAPGVTSTATAEVQQFQKIEDRWDDAVNARDQYALELVLSPLYVGISAAGDVNTRNQEIAAVLSNDDKTAHVQQKVVTVRILGDAAVVNGTYDLHHKSGSGEVDEKGVFTHVFGRQHDRWLCVNSQRTLVREATPGNGKKKQSGKSEEPFHFPIFSRGDKGKE